MEELLTVAIGIGLCISLLFSELFGLAAGGMVVPGYVAIFLDKPVDVLLTVIAAVTTYFIVHLLSTFVIVYGRRRTVLMILVGYLVRMLMDLIPFASLASVGLFGEGEPGFSVIGFIIPGLIAIWIDRQGLIETLAALIAASVAIRLVLIMIYGMEIQQIVR
jgi:poly-gamma-glutamate biosynthesis protein PgsC/CapC